MSSVPDRMPDDRQTPAEALAGLLASAAIAAALVGIAYRPIRIIPFALFFALLACAIGGRHSRLAAAAVAVGTVSFVAGMAVAVITRNPLF